MAKLIGDKPNQVPTNADLGELAYQDVPVVPAPASASSPGTPGQIAFDDSYFYVCIAVDTWERVAIATW